MPSQGKNPYSIQSVENALDVLEALCEFEDDVRISHLSEKLGMNKTSVFRLLATFENRGYVEREKGSGKYRLGLSAYEIGQRFLSRMGLLRKARPVMEKLVRECNEAVYLVVRRGSGVLFLDMVDTSQQVKIIAMVGNSYPLAGNAAGKIMLALFGTVSGVMAGGRRMDLRRRLQKKSRSIRRRASASIQAAWEMGSSVLPFHFSAPGEKSWVAYAWWVRISE